MPWQPKWSTAGAPASPAILHPGLPLSGRTGAVLTPLKAHCSPVRPLFQVLSGAVPPLPPRYSPELRLLVGSILQQNPAPRPTIDDILQTTAVGWAWNIRSYVLSRAEDWLHGTLLSCAAPRLCCAATIRHQLTSHACWPALYPSPPCRPGSTWLCCCPVSCCTHTPSACPQCTPQLPSPPPAQQAQQHLALLPEELRHRCISPALSSERPLAYLLQPIKVGHGAHHAPRWGAVHAMHHLTCTG